MSAGLHPDKPTAPLIPLWTFQWCHAHALLPRLPSHNPFFAHSFPIDLFHFPNNAYPLLFTAMTLGYFESACDQLGQASPVLFVCFHSDWVCKEYGGCRRLYMSLHLLWVLVHSFHKYSLSNAGDRMLCLYNSCFLLGLKLSQHISLQERRSVFLSCLQHGLWVATQLREFLQNDLNWIKANFRMLECDSSALDFSSFLFTSAGPESQ